jgi:hypothetical protein
VHLAPCIVATLLLVVQQPDRLLTTPVPSVSYDVFMRLDVPERVQTFYRISAENRYALMHTHTTRWLRANRARLTRQQAEVVTQMVSALPVEAYELPRSEKTRRLLENVVEIASRAESLLSKEDYINAFSFRGHYVPATK